MRLKNRLVVLGAAIDRHIVIAICIFVIIFSAVCLSKFEYKGSLGGDAKGYVTSAYFLAKHGVFSRSSDPAKPEPDCRRAVGYPFFLAGLMSFFPQMRNNDFVWLFPEKGQKAKAAPCLLPIKYVQAGLLLATAFITAWLVLQLTHRRLAAYFTLWFIGFHPFLERYVHRLYREVFASFLIASFALALYFALTRKRLIYYIIAGGLLGALTLTISQWLYVGAAGVVVLAFCIIMQRTDIRKNLVGLLLMTMVWVAIFYPWELRNERFFGRKILSAGGGVVLEIRSQYNMVPASDYFSAFAYWSRCPLLKSGLLSLVDKKKLHPTIARR